MPRLASHHLHWHWHLELDGSVALRWLFVMRFLRDFVSHLTTFFVPIFVYQQVVADKFLTGLPGTQLQQGMVGIALYFIAYRAVTLVSTVPAGKLLPHTGHVAQLLISHVWFIGYLVSLYAARWYPNLLWLAAICEGLHVSFFWPSYQTIMAKVASPGRMGQDLGLLQFILRLATLMGPAIGGWLIISFGFTTACLVALVGIVLSAIAVSQVHVAKDTDVVSWREFKAWFSEATFDRLAVTYVGRYFNDAVLVLWPVYVFLVLGSVERVGFLYSFSLFLAMIISFLAGIYVDHAKGKKPFLITGIALSMLWIARVQIWNFWHIALINTLEKLAGDFHWLFYDATYIRRGKGSQAYSYFVYRELILSMTALVFWSVVIGLFSFISQGWMGVFGLAAVGVLLSLFIRDSHTDRKQ